MLVELKFQKKQKNNLKWIKKDTKRHKKTQKDIKRYKTEKTIALLKF